MGFKDLNLDLSGINGKIIAIEGNNGAGKTTLLESLGFATLYREFPSRGRGIDKYCSENAYAENKFFFNGIPYTVKIFINPKSGKIESFIYENKTPLNDGKKDSFIECVTNRFGSKELTLSSVFSAQDKSGSFLTIPKSERKNLFISMLNLEILQKISKMSGELEEKEKTKENEILLKIEALKKISETAIPNEAELEKNKNDLSENIRNLTGEYNKILVDISQEEGKYATQQEKINKIKEVSNKINSLSNQIDDLRKEYSAIKNSINKLSSKDDDITMLKTLSDSLSELELKRENEEKELRSAIQEEHNYKTKKNELNSVINECEYKLNSLEEQLFDCRDSSKIISTIPCGGIGKYATCPLIEKTVKKNNMISSIEQRVKEETDRIDLARKEMCDLEVPSYKNKVEERIKKINDEIKKSKVAAARLSEISGNENKIEQLKSKLNGILEKQSIISSELSCRNSELEELNSQISLNGGESRLFKLQKEKSVLNMDLKNNTESLNNINMEIGRAKTIKENVMSAKREIKKYQKEYEAINSERNQWEYLSNAFGPKVIQSIEIDSSGPWVSDIINDLLRTCFDSRFTVKLITQTAKADNSGYKDFFDIEIIDSEKNRSGFINDLSGGEKVICSEAISLGISLYNSYKNGFKWETLYRDECSGALSSSNAVKYINMLRRAIELGNFKRCFFISHQPELSEISDNRIVIKNGSVSIDF
jgi:DNA repair exonuclease SbcCD ATPase subunit